MAAQAPFCCARHQKPQILFKFSKKIPVVHGTAPETASPSSTREYISSSAISSYLSSIRGSIDSVPGSAASAATNERHRAPNRDALPSERVRPTPPPSPHRARTAAPDIPLEPPPMPGPRWTSWGGGETGKIPSTGQWPLFPPR
ncbi:hypothetical protein EKPV-NSW-ORF019 [Eastern grey kangaroopox virus]|uniref:Uncharacterized protein n=1 Tax=Eastern grey kangaroopox virus TaxID=2042482 RepID=A0A2H4QTC0_9POXV|nr:hypothetical protein EKPV-NSW-ORF019 [Eastern grey kangaroopox virus]